MPGALCQTNAKQTSSTAPARTGIKKKRPGHPVTHDDEWIDPGGRMQGAGREHHGHRNADGGGGRPGRGAGGVTDGKSYEGRKQMPADDRARLRGLGVGHAEHQHDGCREGDKRDRHLAETREKMHRQNRAAATAGSPRKSLPVF
jgi:hypothetical protein